jgi:hypothetical protein
MSLARKAADPVATGRRGRFRSAYRDDELVWLVVEARGRVDGPLSQRRFDELRNGLGRPRAPRAAQITRRLGMGWSELVDRTERSPHAVSRALYARAAVASAAGDPVARARWALRVAGLRLGAQRLSAADYDRVRAEVLAAARPGQRPGLPTSQLIKLTGGS